jgi:hypothetical protein
MTEIIYQLGKRYLIAASPQDCRDMLAAGIKIKNATAYGLKAVRSRPNKLYTDNLRKLADVRDPHKLERIRAKYQKVKWMTGSRS